MAPSLLAKTARFARKAFSLRDEIYRVALSKGAAVVIQNAGAIWNTVRMLHGSLPEHWSYL